MFNTAIWFYVFLFWYGDKKTTGNPNHRQLHEQQTPRRDPSVTHTAV